MSTDEAVGNKVESANEIHIHLDSEFGVDWSNVPTSCLWPSMIAAATLATEAVIEDHKRHYKKALQLYKESEQHFLWAINNDAQSNDAKIQIQKKLKQYQDRAVALTSYLDERRRINKLKKLTKTEMVEFK